MNVEFKAKIYVSFIYCCVLLHLTNSVNINNGMWMPCDTWYVCCHEK